jgi:predicted DNA-binding transcriptional regulator AlpA
MAPPTVEKRLPAVNENDGAEILWSLKEIAAHYRTSVTTIYRWISRGYMPSPAKDFGSRRWVRSEVIEALRKVSITRERDRS